MDEKSIRIIPCLEKKENWHMWLGKFMSRAGIKRYYILLTGDAEIPADDSDKNKTME